MTVAGRPPSHPEAEAFYTESLGHLVDSAIPFLLAGTFAVCTYTGLSRATKDLDVFCRPGDYPRILNHFARLGFDTEIEDERWIAKVSRGEHFFDVIFNSTVAVVPVTEAWFENARRISLFGHEVMVTAPTELIWSKVFIQDRQKYDGADIAHVILKQHRDIDWERLLAYMDPYWEVLLIHVLNFRFVYPSERDRVPAWVFDELVRRLTERNALPAAQTRICRGRLFSRADYRMDVECWGFADVVGEAGRKHG